MDPSHEGRTTADRMDAPNADRAQDFAAQAERLRRAGDSEAALACARDGLERDPHHVAGRVALALALFDVGQTEQARAELETIIHVGEAREAEPEPLSELADDELERAFDEASPESDAMIDAERIAMGALRAVEEEGPSGGPELPGAAFRTKTMAQLLEQQGDREGAEAIRASLRSEVIGDPDSGRGDRRIAKLERWLARLRRS